MLYIISAALAAYLIGSVSSAVIISKAVYGEDIRNHGSGNAGATNMMRIHGKKAGAAVLLCIELLMLPVLRDRAVELAVKIGIGFYTDAMRYAKVMPMPLVFAVTGALALLGLGLVLYAVSRERDKNKANNGG